MSPRRAVVDAEALEGLASGEGALPEEIAHYFGRVLRLEAGERVELFDRYGNVVRGSYAPPDRLDAIERVSRERPLPPLVIAQARVRGAKLDEVVRRSTELGASAVWVFDAARSVKCQVRLDRAERIAKDAARQCGRSTLPEVAHLDFDGLIERFGAFGGLRCVCALGEEIPLSRALADIGDAGAAVAIGPEGGFTPQERDLLVQEGAVAVGLGVHVLRTESAASAVLATAQVALGRM